jgi:hypothetical protein
VPISNNAPTFIKLSLPAAVDNGQYECNACHRHKGHSLIQPIEFSMNKIMKCKPATTGIDNDLGWISHTILQKLICTKTSLPANRINKGVRNGASMVDMVGNRIPIEQGWLLRDNTLHWKQGHWGNNQLKIMPAAISLGKLKSLATAKPQAA